ncbi:uncharacterized protein LOC110228482 [Arabidopsis lyrata subsp. lyrata]|uniref:uncharacterized protein LOC110228482 n=1 Tax=Arabidopsis lyrata subsp. lyrata TaxID=81972 RepID=UPI000A29A43F|nr:uncharacterized protein LOC110228482 [Arabidopsis lyrata subsp. lyrata]|eukprot:XP_020881750.1 uncharacterized protein LOC110228482 [Arabidopsis lyrata subsp. lyrata]
MRGFLESNEDSEGSNVIEVVIPMREFHIPQPLMDIIVSKVGEDGVDALKNLLLAGREGKDAVCHNKRCGGLMNLYDMNVCVVQPPFQPGRVGRPKCPRCKRVGHRFNRCVD